MPVTMVIEVVFVRVDVTQSCVVAKETGPLYNSKCQSCFSSKKKWY